MVFWSDQHFDSFPTDREAVEALAQEADEAAAAHHLADDSHEAEVRPEVDELGIKIFPIETYITELVYVLHQILSYR